MVSAPDPSKALKVPKMVPAPGKKVMEKGRFNLGGGLWEHMNGMRVFDAVPLLTQQPVRLQARADTAYSSDWTPEEQVALDATLDKFPAARHTALERYIRAAAVLSKKTVRDVALRVKWLATTSNASKRRLNDDSAGKKRPRVQSIFAVQPKGATTPLGIPAPGVPAPGVPAALPFPAQPSILPVVEDHDGPNGVGVGGPMAQLLEQNYLILNQYKQNMQQYKVHENTELLVRFRDNILTILNQMNSMSGLMQHMPPLPVRLNVELASNFLPKGSYSASGQPVFPTPGALPNSGGYAAQPRPFQPSMNVAPVVLVSSAAQQAKSSSQDTKASGRNKSKSSTKRSATTKAEERTSKVKPELRTSARRAAQKGQPARSSEVRASARIAAASDSAQS